MRCDQSGGSVNTLSPGGIAASWTLAKVSRFLASASRRILSLAAAWAVVLSMTRLARSAGVSPLLFEGLTLPLIDLPADC